MKTNTLAAVSLLLGSFSAFAVETSPTIITATRTAQTANETLVSVTVISRQDIEKQQAQSVQDLLKNVAGIDIGNNGGAGKTTSLFLRGTESDHVLVLIDGIKVGSATLGSTAFQDIPIEQIERIEIVRGPRSSLYGSEAIGGVIQLFTRQAKTETTQTYLSLGGGSYRTFNASAGASRNDKKSWLSINANVLNTEGFNACKGSFTSGCFTIEPDKDGYHNLSASLNGGYRFENGAKISIHALQADSDVQYDGSYTNSAKSTQQVLGGKLDLSLADIWQAALTIGRSQDQSNNFINGNFINQIDTQRISISLQNDFTIGENHLITLGTDFQDDTIDSTTAYTINSRNNTGLFAQYLAAYTKNDWQFSLRQDDNEQFGKHTTGGASWGVTLIKNLRMIASYGTAYKAPTFNELYYPNSGNANLNPEESRSTELSLANIGKSIQWSVNLYETHIKNLIANDATFTPENIDQTRIRGIDLVFNTNIMSWDVHNNITFLEPKNRSTGTNRGHVLARRAQQSLNLAIDRQFKHVSLGATILAKGRRYDNLANTKRLTGYAILDFRTEYQINSAWRLQARIENVLDKAYETASTFNQAGRSLYLTFRYQP